MWTHVWPMKWSAQPLSVLEFKNHLLRQSQPALPSIQAAHAQAGVGPLAAFSKVEKLPTVAFWTFGGTWPAG